MARVLARAEMDQIIEGLAGVRPKQCGAMAAPPRERLRGGVDGVEDATPSTTDETIGRVAWPSAGRWCPGPHYVGSSRSRTLQYPGP